MEKIAIFITKIFSEPIISLFYFTALLGMGQLLNLGRDIYYRGLEDETENETTSA